MSRHDASHELRLQEFLTGGGDARADLMHSELSACPLCRATLEEQLELAGRLDALGVAERASLEEASRGPDAGIGRAEAALRARILADTLAAKHAPGGPAHVHRPWTWLGLVAAAVLVVVLIELRRDEPLNEPSPDTILGSTLELSEPVGQVSAFDDFRWSGELPPGGWYRVVVYAPTDDGSFEEQAVSGRLDQPYWTPAPRVLASLPSEIRWTVEVYRGTGQGDLVDSVSARAWR